MTGICGLIGSSNGLQRKSDLMLSQMQRRGSEFRTFSQDPTDDRGVMIGICGSGPLPSLDKVSTPIALDGVFFENEKETSGRTLSGPERLIRTPGAFSFLFLFQEKLSAGRDIMGQKPLYFGRARDGTIGFCSLRSPLVSIGVENPSPVPPGQLIQVSWEGRTETTDFALKQTGESSPDEQGSVERLKELFSEAVRKTVPRHSGIAFSGGLDSSLVAQFAKEEGLEAELISVGLKGQVELEHAVRTAESLELRIHLWELSESEVLDALPDVVETIESCDPTIVGISVPIYFACLKAQQLGLKFITAGQLSDELFGGYGRFEEMAREKETESLATAMFASVVAASSNDFDPGDKLAVAAGLELCCPFAYLPFVEYSLSIPSSLKVRVENGKAIRKYILRKLAARQGLPGSVVDRPKKAVQYSSGVQRLLLKEAKRRGVSLGEMLESFTK